MRLERPVSNQNQFWSYLILTAAFLFTMVSLLTALKAFNKQRGDTPFFTAVTKSKDPSTFIVLLGDVGDVLGLIVAFLGVFLGQLLHDPYFDGIASMIIGAIMIAISILLVRESKSLLMGETTSRKTLRKIVKLTEADTAVLKVKRHFSMYLSPEEVLLQLNTVFKDDLSTQQITDAIERIIKTIQTEFPKIKQIFIEPVADKSKHH